ncbi:skin secretory protein xP2-like [Pipra filicauda]|uniref:Skin secretory protein xP2-like n=1 Tax=Pipra filicauda TaxID=649802 RepID=A0A7R5KWH8_9PASS|nr:skin secretory protein xP2-like [Pipra filicauda]XP_039245454.1 skin secretory protein xP2-like [Pipra filicauda]XP_039245455.1 skin secretory protein xP2-like [Pipra filicauda]XP_039245456.1 skin secretory protein xP2-like [Pipra filicauda]
MRGTGRGRSTGRGGHSGVEGFSRGNFPSLHGQLCALGRAPSVLSVCPVVVPVELHPCRSPVCRSPGALGALGWLLWDLTCRSLPSSAEFPRPRPHPGALPGRGWEGLPSRWMPSLGIGPAPGWSRGVGCSGAPVPPQFWGAPSGPERGSARSGAVPGLCSPLPAPCSHSRPDPAVGGAHPIAPAHVLIPAVLPLPSRSVRVSRGHRGGTCPGLVLRDLIPGLFPPLFPRLPERDGQSSAGSCPHSRPQRIWGGGRASVPRWPCCPSPVSPVGPSLMLPPCVGNLWMLFHPCPVSLPSSQYPCPAPSIPAQLPA